MIILTKLFSLREVGRPAAGVCRVRSSVARVGLQPEEPELPGIGGRVRKEPVDTQGDGH